MVCMYSCQKFTSLPETPHLCPFAFAGEACLLAGEACLLALLSALLLLHFAFAVRHLTCFEVNAFHIFN